jgi:hypothetical protein
MFSSGWEVGKQLQDRGQFDQMPSGIAAVLATDPTPFPLHVGDRGDMEPVAVPDVSDAEKSVRPRIVRIEFISRDLPAVGRES